MREWVSIFTRDSISSWANTYVHSAYSLLATSNAVRLTDGPSVKQASHWHDKRFTPRHAVWRANEVRTRDSVRGDVGQVTIWARILFPQCPKLTCEVVPFSWHAYAILDTYTTNGLRRGTQFSVRKKV